MTVSAAGPTVVDLFAGCGGMTRGFVEAGARSVMAIEWDRAAASSYAANFGSAHVIAGDIADVDDSEFPEADLVIGGPPCQGFSGLGTNDPLDPRNSLWREYMRAVRAVRPKVFVLENVDRFSSSGQFALLLNELNGGSLREWNTVSWGVLNTADYGVPQRRRRTILIASRVGEIKLPEPTHDRDGSAGRQRWRTVRHAFRGVPYAVETNDLPGGRTRRFFGVEMPGAFSSAELHVARRPTRMSLTRYAHIPPGGGRLDLPFDLQPPCWQRKATGTTDVMGRLEWGLPSVTIRTEFFKPEKGRYLHPQWDRLNADLMVNRPITHYEAALLQSFPRRTKWVGSKIQIARQIGNAVPPLFAQRIAEHVIASL